MENRGTSSGREAGVAKQRSGSDDPTFLLEDLVRVLARSAAREAYEACQTKKDDVTNDH